ncbi:MAG TPA: molybdopterin molybdotransferase MoeA [Saprospiraceae bacterium]|nr:molybdopterin molybdotransferase MoeA [Saprospiraceae bacterium]
MISVSEARKLIDENCKGGRSEVMRLIDALDRALSDDVVSPMDTPPFHQSAVDGYAFSFKDWDGKSKLEVAGEVQAGNVFTAEIKPRQAIRIFTGAPVPAGLDTVVMQEKIEVQGDQMTIKDPLLVAGANVRLQGSQTKIGDVVLKKSHRLTPASISFLASLGITEVPVFAHPHIRIIVTGKELVAPGGTIKEGQIFESNSFALKTALKAMGISPVSAEIVEDDEVLIMEAITRALDSDIVILTGGASVGLYDLVPSSLAKCGVKEIFHKVKQKPGKPFYFGTYGDVLVFALPGNPAAVLSCFYEYITPAIGKFTGRQYHKRLKMILAHDFQRKPGLTQFMKGKTKANTVFILDHQESYLMNSFAHADALVELEEDREVILKGDLVNVLMILF